jgi:hypothetical protein
LHFIHLASVKLQNHRYITKLGLNYNEILKIIINQKLINLNPNRGDRERYDLLLKLNGFIHLSIIVKYL